jgi:hypothetical protein
VELANALMTLLGQLAWPIVFLALGLIFKREIRSIFSAFPDIAERIKKVGPVELQEAISKKFPSDPLTDKSANESPPQQPQLNFPAPPPAPANNDPALGLWLDNIRKIIAELHLSEPELRERLIQALAMSSRHHDFLKTANAMYGTQLAALKEIRASGHLSPIALQRLHGEHLARPAPLQKSDFLSWIGFLRDTLLIAMDKDGDYKLTPVGNDFLDFVAANGIIEGIG